MQFIEDENAAYQRVEGKGWWLHFKPHKHELVKDKLLDEKSIKNCDELGKQCQRIVRFISPDDTEQDVTQTFF